jgi:epoxyqueuosine reductase
MDRPARDIKLWLSGEARRLGFDVCRIAATEGRDWRAKLDAWLSEGRHAGMDWMTERADQRAAPGALWPEARSAVMLGLNYGPETDPLATLARPDAGTISVYARGKDYHDLIRGRLKELAQKLQSRAARKTGLARPEVKVFVDTAPLMEKPLAEAAGLGWQGKHTVLVSREFGNWLFLGCILTTLDLPPDEAEQDRCGTCSRCLAACPTDAFPAPYVLDSARCISYLTIEHEGHIDRSLRPLMGNRIYGCDDCLAVCPWNKFAEAGRDAKLKARDDLAAPPLAELLELDDTAFRRRFSGSPIKRTGRDRFIRNVLIAAGNAAPSRGASDAAASAALAGAALLHVASPNPIVRAAAVWALGRLDAGRAAALKPEALARETDPDVIAEWEAGPLGEVLP